MQTLIPEDTIFNMGTSNAQVVFQIPISDEILDYEFTNYDVSVEVINEFKNRGLKCTVRVLLDIPIEELKKFKSISNYELESIRIFMDKMKVPYDYPSPKD